MNTENELLRNVRKVSWDDVNTGVIQLAQLIRRDIVNDELNEVGDITAIVAFSRGGLPIATMLAHALEIPVIYTETEFTTVHYFLDGKADPDHILLVDDISDSGSTFHNFLYHDEDSTSRPRFPDFKFTTVSLYMRAGTKYVPDYAMYNAGNDWICFPWEINPTEIKEI